MYEYHYLFYNHGYMGEGEADRIIEYIEDHNFEAFMEFYDWFNNNRTNNPKGLEFFPNHITVFKDDGGCDSIPLTKENFMVINVADCEHG